MNEIKVDLYTSNSDKIEHGKAIEGRDGISRMYKMSRSVKSKDGSQKAFFNATVFVPDSLEIGLEQGTEYTVAGTFYFTCYNGKIDMLINATSIEPCTAMQTNKAPKSTKGKFLGGTKASKAAKPAESDEETPF